MAHTSINLTGALTDRESLVNGSRTYRVEGEDNSGAGWRLVMSFRWPVQSEAVDEGDVTVVDPAGGELYGTLSDGTAAELTDQDGEVEAARIDLQFDVTGGDGSYASASGRIHVTGTIAGQGGGTGGSFEGEPGEASMLTADLDIEGAETGMVGE